MSDDKKKPEELDDKSLDASQGGIGSGNITLTGTGGSGASTTSGGGITLMGTGGSGVDSTNADITLMGTGGNGAAKLDSSRIKPIKR